jgi:methyl-accepting chemotaxis protein
LPPRPYALAMSSSSKPRRLAGLLRRTPTDKHDGQAPLDDGAAWSAHAVAKDRSREAAEAAQGIAAHVAKQRAAADILTDRLHTASARAGELASGFGRVTDAFERLGLVALNAGLEGARLGELAGKSLLLVSEEVRSHVVRGSESARELTATLGDVATEVGKLQLYVDQVRQGAMDASQEAARVTALASEAERSIVELGTRLEEATGSDPETARLVAQVSEHAKALIGALGALRGKASPKLVTSALRPVLGPLAGLLGDSAATPDSEPRPE